MPHLRKCFENIVAVKFTPANELKTMFSAEGEKVNLSEVLPYMHFPSLVFYALL